MNSLWKHRTSHVVRSETNGIDERALRRIKEGTSAVLRWSGLDDKWWSDFVECYCCLRNVQELLGDGKRPPERRFWGILQRTNSSLWCIGIPPKFWEVKLEFNSERKFCQEYCQEMLWLLWDGEFQSCGSWFSNFVRKRPWFPRTHSETGTHRAENLKVFILKNQKMTRKFRKSFWFFQGDFFCRYRVELRDQLYVPKKCHARFLLK